MPPSRSDKIQAMTALDALYQREMPQADSSLFQAASYHFQNPGKSFRAQLALTSGEALGLNEQDNLHWAAACELLHNASLIHDDISDASTHRRGQESINQHFGSDMALCLGDWMVAKAFELSARNRNVGGQLTALLAQAMQETCSGQMADISQRQCAELEDWQRIAKGKTAPLLVVPIKGAALAAGLDSDLEGLERLVGLCGLAYQGRNDIDDIIPSSHRSADLWGRKPNLVVSLFAEKVSHSDEFTHWYHSGDCSRVAQWQQRIASSEAILLAHQQVEAWLAEANHANQLQTPPLRTVVNQLIQTVTPKTNTLANQGYIA